MHMKDPRIKLQPWSEQPLVSVDGTPLKVFGQVAVDLSLGGDKFKMGGEPTNYRSHFGFMAGNAVNLDIGKAQLKIGNRPPIQMRQPTQYSCQGVLGRKRSNADSLPRRQYGRDSHDQHDQGTTKRISASYKWRIKQCSRLKRKTRNHLCPRLSH